MTQKEAIKILKDFHDNSALFSVRTALETLHPELAESEDEKIKRCIIDTLKGYHHLISTGGITKEDMINWLEKQESVGEIVERCKSSWYNEGKIAGMAEGLIDDEKYQQGWHDALEKQGANSVTITKGNTSVTNAEVVSYPTTSTTIEPKFKVGDIMRTLQEANDGYIDGMPVVVSIDNEYYHCNNELIAIKDQDDYEYPPMNRRQKPIDKVEPKFKVGDFVVNNNSGSVYQVTKIKDDEYCIWPLYAKIEGYLRITDVDNDYHLWSIEDAKDGDVLITKEDKRPFIFKGLLDPNHPNCPVAYCGINSENLFHISTGDYWWTDEEVCPATKEQCDTLMKAMTEAGYTFDFKKKELKELNLDDLIEESYQQQADDLIDMVTEKHAWSEEDDSHIRGILSELQIARSKAIVEQYKDSISSDIDWLKSIKNRLKGE